MKYICIQIDKKKKRIEEKKLEKKNNQANGPKKQSGVAIPILNKIDIQSKVIEKEEE